MSPVYDQCGRLVGYSIIDFVEELDIDEFQDILGDRIHYIKDTYTDDLYYVSLEEFQKCALLSEEIIQRCRIKK